MKILRKILDSVEHHFMPGGKFERFYPLFEGFDTFAFQVSKPAKGLVHIRDGIDFKSMMSYVVLATLPVWLIGLYNVGLQANLALLKLGETTIPGIRGEMLHLLGVGVDPASIIGCFLYGLSFWLPIYIVINVAGGFWEVLFSIVRKHEINEGFFVTSMLFSLIVPPTAPLWQIAIAISFAVVFGKEVFGGTGMNFINPALLARMFLFFAYPADISGDFVWIAVDGFSAPTLLSQAHSVGVGALQSDWWSAFFGLRAGSIGETSVIGALIGAIFLIYTGIGSWRIMLSVCIGTFFMATLFNLIGSETNPMLAVAPMWHFVLGGFAFGTVFMATDPVSASSTRLGQYFYGLFIGILVVLIRVLNPAYPEGMMFAIILGNIIAPTIDHLVVMAHIKKREAFYGRN